MKLRVVLFVFIVFTLLMTPNTFGQDDKDIPALPKPVVAVTYATFNANQVQIVQYDDGRLGLRVLYLNEKEPHVVHIEWANNPAIVFLHREIARITSGGKVTLGGREFIFTGSSIMIEHYVSMEEKSAEDGILFCYGTIGPKKITAQAQGKK